MLVGVDPTERYARSIRRSPSDRFPSLCSLPSPSCRSAGSAAVAVGTDPANSALCGSRPQAASQHGRSSAATSRAGDRASKFCSPAMRQPVRDIFGSGQFRSFAIPRSCRQTPSGPGSLCGIHLNNAHGSDEVIRAGRVQTNVYDLRLLDPRLRRQGQSASGRHGHRHRSGDGNQPRRRVAQPRLRHPSGHRPLHPRHRHPPLGAVLRLAIECADTVGLGYLGADIIMDRDLGPLMLELNARPGLSVQVANQRGLLINLNRVQAMANLPESVAERLGTARRCKRRGSVAHRCSTNSTWRPHHGGYIARG